jgi:hypothetical protein
MIDLSSPSQHITTAQAVPKKAAHGTTAGLPPMVIATTMAIAKTSTALPWTFRRRAPVGNSTRRRFIIVQSLFGFTVGFIGL